MSLRESIIHHSLSQKLYKVELINYSSPFYKESNTSQFIFKTSPCSLSINFALCKRKRRGGRGEGKERANLSKLDMVLSSRPTWTTTERRDQGGGKAEIGMPTQKLVPWLKCSCRDTKGVPVFFNIP